MLKKTRNILIYNHDKVKESIHKNARVHPVCKGKDSKMQNNVCNMRKCDNRMIKSLLISSTRGMRDH